MQPQKGDLECTQFMQIKARSHALLFSYILRFLDHTLKYRHAQRASYLRWKIFRCSLVFRWIFTHNPKVLHYARFFGQGKSEIWILYGQADIFFWQGLLIWSSRVLYDTKGWPGVDFSLHCFMQSTLHFVWTCRAIHTRKRSDLKV